MKKILLLSVACGGLTLSACDHYSSRLASMESPRNNQPQQIAYNYADNGDVSQISPAAGGELIDSRTFGQYLRNEYIKLAKYEHDEAYDYRAAKYYMNKIEALGDGTMVAPASFYDFEIAEERSADLVAAREELVYSLENYKSPENRYALARAQSRFDCWMERAEESGNPEKVRQCQMEFREALDSLTPPMSMDLAFTIPFDDGSQQLSQEARKSLGSVLHQWRMREEKGDNQLILRPSVAMDKEESERQIAIVRSILEYNGIGAENISIVQDDQSANEEFNVIIRQNTVEIEEALEESATDMPPIL